MALLRKQRSVNLNICFVGEQNKTVLRVKILFLFFFLASMGVQTFALNYIFPSFLHDLKILKYALRNTKDRALYFSPLRGVCLFVVHHLFTYLTCTVY